MSANFLRKQKHIILLPLTETGREFGLSARRTFLKADFIFRPEGKKEVSRQIAANPNVEICAFKDGEWLRLSGELVEDDRREARVSMLDAYPELKAMYDPDDGNTQVFYFKNATAVFSSFTKPQEVIEF